MAHPPASGATIDCRSPPFQSIFEIFGTAPRRSRGVLGRVRAYRERAGPRGACARISCRRRWSPSIPRRTASITTSTRPVWCRSPPGSRSILIDPARARRARQSSRRSARCWRLPDIRKVFHAAEYDLFVLKRDCGFQFANLFDTMISAQLLGYPAIGLAALAERHFDVSAAEGRAALRLVGAPAARQPARPTPPPTCAYLIPLAGDAWRRSCKQGQAPRVGAGRVRDADRRGSGPIASSTSSATCASRARASSIRKPRRCCESSTWCATSARARSTGRRSRCWATARCSRSRERSRRATNALAQIKGVTDLILRRFGREVHGRRERGHQEEARAHPEEARRLGPAAPAHGPQHRAARGHAEEVARARGPRSSSSTPACCARTRRSRPSPGRTRTKGSDLAGVAELKPWFAESFGARSASRCSAGRGRPRNSARRPRPRKEEGPSGTSEGPFTTWGPVP